MAMFHASESVLWWECTLWCATCPLVCLEGRDCYHFSHFSIRSRFLCGTINRTLSKTKRLFLEAVLIRRRTQCRAPVACRYRLPNARQFLFWSSFVYLLMLSFHFQFDFNNNKDLFSI